jgi:hypothetical protein
MKYGRHTKAFALIAILSVFISGCQDSELTPLELAKLSYKSGDWETTIDACSLMLDRNPKEGEAIYLRGQSYLALSMFPEAIRDYTAYIELDPSDPERYYLRKMAYQRAEMPELAAADAKLGQSIDVKYKTAYPIELSSLTPRTIDLSKDSVDESEADAKTEDVEETERSLLMPVENGDEAGNAGFVASKADADASKLASKSGDESTMPESDTVADASSVRDEPIVESPLAPQAPAAPVIPGQDALMPNADVAADDLGGGQVVPDGKSFHQAWVAQQRAAAALRDNGSGQVPEATSAEGDESPSSSVTRQFTTSLPPSFADPKARPASPNYLPNVSGIGLAASNSGARATGLKSTPNLARPLGQPTTGILSTPNPALAADQVKGILPGKFKGNTLYQPGKKITLSTSIPGTKPTNGTAPLPTRINTRLLGAPPPAQRKGTLTRGAAKGSATKPVLGTQLPASRTVPSPLPKP